MNDSIRLGSIRGIRMGMHWSVAFVALLLAWGLATRILPWEAPGASAVAYWATGIGVALLFFASLLAHEMAHAFFARRAGIKVEGITLWLLGGVAKLDGDAPTPGHELRIAASGPLVSALVGVVFGFAAAGLASAGAPVLLVEGSRWLSRVNIGLAVFNLLPGAPLDGGRVVKAIAWRLGRNRLRASVLATRLGRALGFGLIALGMFELVAGQDVGGSWTIVIGLFMTGAASAEQSQEVTRSVLEGLLVRDVMTPDPVRVPAGLTVDLFLTSVLVAQRQTAALVTEAGGELLGVAGLDATRKGRGSRLRDGRVRDIALPIGRVPVAAPGEDLLAAFERTETEPEPAGGRVKGAWLLVVEDGAIVGLVSPVDLARTLADRQASGARGPLPARVGPPASVGPPTSVGPPASPAP